VVLVSFAAAVLLLVLAIVDVATIGTAALVLAVALLIIVTGAIARSVSRMITDDDGE
jgi:hypothetical protein